SGVKVNLEIHMTYITPSAALAHRLVSHFDPRYIGVIYDPGNMVREGYEAWRLGLELLGPYVSHVHVKNAAWEPAGQEEDGTQRWEAREAPLWKGLVNWRQVLAELRIAGYEGYLSLEDFSIAQPTREKLAADLAYLKRLEEGTVG
ncbi:MAG: sugar phosphate isomerase/epimerase family protein, partial [Anaerolineae bacterium]